jgi:hypothetical protein
MHERRPPPRNAVHVVDAVAVQQFGHRCCRRLPAYCTETPSVSSRRPRGTRASRRCLTAQITPQRRSRKLQGASSSGIPRWDSPR